ncbi:hypothetical protein [Halioxenophilus aromaticivorans]|uniref:hypothetical protein n=1 Tax=Halioxenophilus aromaticivorans TaxID=1306992 RepID=UPI0031E846B4
MAKFAAEPDRLAAKNNNLRALQMMLRELVATLSAGPNDHKLPFSLEIKTAQKNPPMISQPQSSRLQYFADRQLT